MQQNQQERRFTHSAPQQPVYRFPQNQNSSGWQPQQGFDEHSPEEKERKLSRKDQRELKRLHRRKHRRIFTLWNLFAFIGIITTVVQVARYVVIPALVYLNMLTGGIQ